MVNIVYKLLTFTYNLRAFYVLIFVQIILCKLSTHLHVSFSFLHQSRGKMQISVAMQNSASCSDLILFPSSTKLVLYELQWLTSIYWILPYIDRPFTALLTTVVKRQLESQRNPVLNICIFTAKCRSPVRNNNGCQWQGSINLEEVILYLF
jgi:hypothetical protein